MPTRFLWRSLRRPAVLISVNGSDKIAFKAIYHVRPPGAGDAHA